MAKTVELKLILTGRYAGKTGKLNGYTFTEGLLDVVTTEKDAAGIANYFGKSYQAFREGSEQLQAAQDRDRERNGEPKISESAGDGENDNLPTSEVQSEGSTPSTSSTEYGPGATDSTPRDARLLPNGDGHPDPGLPPGTEQGRAVKIVAAFEKLDPSDNEHWTALGLPLLSAVERFYGGSDITRQMVRGAAPKFTRAVAARV